MERLEAKRKANAKKIVQKDLSAKQIKLLKRDFAIATATPEGLNLMKYIFNLSCYSKILIAGNPEIGLNVLEGTLYNNVRRAIWLELRQLIPVRTLKKIEYEKLNLNVEEL